MNDRNSVIQLQTHGRSAGITNEKLTFVKKGFAITIYD